MSIRRPWHSNYSTPFYTRYDPHAHGWIGEDSKDTSQKLTIIRTYTKIEPIYEELNVQVEWASAHQPDPTVLYSKPALVGARIIALDPNLVAQNSELAIYTFAHQIESLNLALVQLGDEWVIQNRDAQPVCSIYLGADPHKSILTAPLLQALFLPILVNKRIQIQMRTQIVKTPTFADRIQQGDVKTHIQSRTYKALSIEPTSVRDTYWMTWQAI